MKSILALACFASVAFAVMSVGCIAETPDESLGDETASEEVGSVGRASGRAPIDPCPDGTIYEPKIQACPGGGLVDWLREWWVERHWSPITHHCVVDSKTCDPWVCEPCP